MGAPSSTTRPRRSRKEIIDKIVARRRWPQHPGGTKGKGTRGGKGRETQLKCVVNDREAKAIVQALAIEVGPQRSVSAAMRIALLSIAKRHGLLPADCAVD